MSMAIDDAPLGGSPEHTRTIRYRDVTYLYGVRGGVECFLGVRYEDRVAYGHDGYAPPSTDD